VSVSDEVGAVAAAPPRSTLRRLLAFVFAYAAAAPFVFFLFFLIRGGWLALGIALMAFPASLIWLALNSLPQGAALGLLVGLVPERWPRWLAGLAALLLGAATTMANSLWLGLALVGTPASAVNLISVGLVGGAASFVVARILCYALAATAQRPA
jgi:hypothetical protein